MQAEVSSSKIQNDLFSVNVDKAHASYGFTSQFFMKALFMKIL